MSEPTDRRASNRVPSSQLVTLLVGDGEYRGSRFVAMTTDISAGGICVVLDGGSFSRGTSVQVQYEDGLYLDGWISHTSRGADLLTRLGISIAPLSDGKACEQSLQSTSWTL